MLQNTLKLDFKEFLPLRDQDKDNSYIYPYIFKIIYLYMFTTE